jgi:hypothetical protein
MTERASRLTGLTFRAPDLNRIVETIRQNQERDIEDPSRPSDQLWTNPEGEILTGTVVDPSRARGLSRITQETFYASDQARLAEERRIATEKMPPGTQYSTDGTYGGWVYSVTNEFQDTYTMFLWYDTAANRYEVSLLSPRLGGSVNVHECHLYTNGVLCLRQDGGYKKMDRAYARSVLWTRGASCYQRGYGFQFNMD